MAGHVLCNSAWVAFLLSITDIVVILRLYILVHSQYCVSSLFNLRDLLKDSVRHIQNLLRQRFFESAARMCRKARQDMVSF